MHKKCISEYLLKKLIATVIIAYILSCIISCSFSAPSLNASDILNNLIESGTSLSKPEIMSVDSKAFTTREDKRLEIKPQDIIDKLDKPNKKKLKIIEVFNGDHGEVSLSVNGDVVFIPEKNYSGTTNFRYRLSDNSTGTVDIVVTKLNDPPVAADDELVNFNKAEIKEDSSNIVISTQDLLINDTDIDKDTLSIISVSPSSEKGGILYLAGSEVIYTPKANYHGPDSFTYTVQDSNGATDTATVRFNIVAVNHAPKANIDKFTTNTGVPLDIPFTSLLANDTDSDSDQLTVTGITPSLNADITYDEPGDKLIYNSKTGFNGTDIFTYTVSDGKESSSGLVKVYISPESTDTIVAHDDSIKTDEDTPKTVNVAELFANDVDKDHNGIAITSLTVPEHGKVSLSDDKSFFIYSPNHNYNGEDSFTYNIASANGSDTSAGVVNITVAPVDDAIVTSPDKFVTNENVSIVLAPKELLSNDINDDQDILTITNVDEPVNGTVKLKDGRIIFIPNKGFSGTASFKYTASSSKGNQSKSLVTVIVNPISNLK